MPNRDSRPRLSFANVTSLLALFVALGGTSYAVATGSIDSREIKDDTIRGKDIRTGAVGSGDIRNGTVRSRDLRNNDVSTQDVRDGSLTAADVAAGSLTLDRLNAPGAVLMFNRPACPAGWSELTAARGRYLIGRPAGSQAGGTLGTALASGEDRPTGRHDHGVSDPTHFHNYQPNWGFNDTADSGTVRRPLFDFKPADAVGRPDIPALVAGETGLTVDAAGGATGTNAPYIQLLPCQKQ